MGAYLEMLRSGLKVSTLVSGVFPAEQAERAFRALATKPPSAPLVLLEFSANPVRTNRVALGGRPQPSSDRIKVAVVGPGSFCRSVHLPNLAGLKRIYSIHTILARRGHTAKEVALRFGASNAATDYGEVLRDAEIDLVFISTRHDLHAPLAIRALEAGKAVFTEKPAAVNPTQLAELEQAIRETRGTFVVGFNRRFSPHICRLKTMLQGRNGPAMLHYRINALPLPEGHWIQTAEGGGRVIGEVCHFVDLLGHLVGARLRSVYARSLAATHHLAPPDDNFQALLSYEDGSLATLLYTSLGAKSLPKEYLEVFFDGSAVTINDFLEYRTHGSQMRSFDSKRQSKGHLEQLERLGEFLRSGGPPPVTPESALAVTRVTFEIADQLRRGDGAAMEAGSNSRGPVDALSSPTLFDGTESQAT
jgi:predicted dehydrogenase